jgi:UPF0716 family protein affecting phage T7 exclusion
MNEPWSQFCRHTDGSWDYDEWHALILGLLLFFPLWWPICRWNVGEPARLMASETWYIAPGTIAQAVGLILLIGEIL